MRIRWLSHPLFWLAVMVSAFFAVSCYAGFAAYYGNFSGGGPYDAGVVTQAVASTALGHHAPFYESADCLAKARCSFLLVHPGFILYLAVPFYELFPSMLTLFTLRSLVVAAAAIPLYWLTRQATNSPVKALLASGLYLLWAPTLAADVYSLHLESLLPLELFSLAALWQAGRYRWGFLAALAAFLTIEIAPIFVLLIGVFFLLPYGTRELRRFFRSSGNTKSPLVLRMDEALRRIVRGLRTPQIRSTLALVLASVVAYVVLYTFMNTWGYEILGVAAPTVPPGLSGLFYNNASHPVFNLRALLHSSRNLPSVEYWLILYALVGFIPLLSPRSLVIALPWIGWTFFDNGSKFTTIGPQYTMIAAVPIFIGLAYGLRRVTFPKVGPTVTEVEAAGNHADPGVSPASVRWYRRSRPVVGVWATVLGAVIVANVLLSPINPALEDLGVTPRDPFTSGYFYLPFPIPSGFRSTQAMAALIPGNASVVASKGFFPFVANLPYAIELVSNFQASMVPNLPFNVTQGPDFVLTDLSFLPPPNSYLGRNVSDPSEYDLRAFVGSTGDGPALLYERGYHAVAERFGPPLPAFNSSYDPGESLSPGALGLLTSNNSTSPSGKVIVSRSLGATGVVWSGPHVFLSPGNYTIRVATALTWTNRSLNLSAPAVRVSLTGYSGLIKSTSMSASQFISGRWTVVSLSLTTADPIPEFEVVGSLLDTRYVFAVAAMSIGPVSA